MKIIVLALTLGFLIISVLFESIEGVIILGIVSLSAFFIIYVKENDYSEMESLQTKNIDHEVYIQGSAIYLKDNKSTEGELRLTQTKIIFKSEGNKNTYFPISQITSVNLFRSSYLLIDGVVISVNGMNEKFIVKYAKDWRHIISFLCKQEAEKAL